jgi:glutamyl-tRNA reductase
LKLTMAGLDWSRAPVALREALSFVHSRVVELDGLLARYGSGCVLLSTCNRTEIYLSGAAEDVHPGELLCREAGVDFAPLAGAFTLRRDEDAARHLMEVAGGLHSQIWGEDQILTQVKTALERARLAHSADSVLERVFGGAAAAGKRIKSTVRLQGVPTSAAARAVEVLEQACGGLAGRRALVIGSGEMGRLAARLLGERGCTVTVTLRTYRHGGPVLPAGCAGIPYEERYRAVEQADLLLSATASPHETITVDGLAGCSRRPLWMVDLAIPRDIQPQVGQLPGVRLFNVDDLGGAARAIPPQAAEIVDEAMADLERWERYRACLPGLEQVKDAIYRRLLATGLEGEDPLQAAVSRTVDLLAGALGEEFTPQALEACAKKLDRHTAARPGRAGRGTQGQEGYPFPAFLRLAGRRAVVIGGGAVACRRAEALAAFGADVTVIAPSCTAPLSGVDWLERPYRPGDLAGAHLAVAATDDRAVNRAVGEEARRRGIPVSVADAPEECTFFFPALAQGGGVVAGVAGRGDDHRRTARAAAAVRRALEGVT